MSKPTKGHRAPHFSPAVCEHACHCFSDAYYVIEGKAVASERLPSLRAGPKPHPVLAAAYESFQREFLCDGQLITQARECSKENFRWILRTHWHQYFVNRTCPRPVRRKLVSLTDDETHELAGLLCKRPQLDDGTYVAHENLAAAAKSYDRVKELIDKANATDAVLKQHLLDNVPGLKYQREDVAYALAPTTRMKRRSCAEILRGDAPWFKRPRTHQTRGQAPSKDADSEDVYWKQDWWAQHVFIGDATHFSDFRGDEKAKDSAPHVFVMSTDPPYPPREVPRPKSIRQSTSLMVYVVWHWFLGLVVGPDLMFTGTRLPFDEDLTREEQFKAHGLQSWYVTHPMMITGSMILIIHAQSWC